MAEDVRCFMIEQTETVRVRLRRYASSDQDPRCVEPHWYHNAVSPPIRDEKAQRDPEGWRYTGWGRPPTDDERGLSLWPERCANCPYVFIDDDEWQVHASLLYRDDDEVECELPSAPPGAMWDAEWMKSLGTGPDGRSLIVRLPDGFDWAIDGPTRDGSRWTREGDPPAITVRPSILSPNYHGFLTDGVLRSV